MLKSHKIYTLEKLIRLCDEKMTNSKILVIFYSKDLV